VAGGEVAAFVRAGYDCAAVVAAAFGVAVKTFANALAHLARAPVDPPLAPALAALHM
jgi:hypothetical protein